MRIISARREKLYRKALEFARKNLEEIQEHVNQAAPGHEKVGNLSPAFIDGCCKNALDGIKMGLDG